MMRYFVELGLFENSQGTITCLKLARRLDKSMTSNPEMRATIEKLRSNNHDEVMTQSCLSHDKSMTESENVMQDKIRSDQNRLDKKPSRRFTPPSVQEVHEYMIERDFDSGDEAEKFFDFYESKGWLVGKSKMKDWKAAVRNWLKGKMPPKKPRKQPEDNQIPAFNEMEYLAKNWEL